MKGPNKETTDNTSDYFTNNFSNILTPIPAIQPTHCELDISVDEPIQTERLACIGRRRGRSVTPGSRSISVNCFRTADS